MKTLRFFSLEKYFRAVQSIRFYSEIGSHGKLIDGKGIAERLLEQLKVELVKWINSGNRPPHLSVVMVGGNPSNVSYVNMKCKAASNLGISTHVYELSKSTSQSDLIKLITEMNHNSLVDGILVQLPLSDHMHLREVCETISPQKDVDGFTPDSLGQLCCNNPTFVSCTALAVHHIISSLGKKMSGNKAVVCSRSKHVGLPIALLLHSSTSIGNAQSMNMTTTICHRHTPPDQMKDFIKSADVIVSAVGKPNLIRGNMIKPGAVVIDVAFSEIYEGNKRRVVGDVNLQEVQQVASAVSPVPGGVGPVTVAMLMYNTFLAAKNRGENMKNHGVR